jgi:uncharacterized protein YdaU (DUF1376 family)
MSGFPRLSIHIGDYLKDTLPISRKNFEHHGIYLLALMLAWNSPLCRLPNDKKWLAERFGCTPAECAEIVLPVLRRYFKTDGYWLRQKRLVAEYNFIKNKRRVRRGAAKSRWDNEKNCTFALHTTTLNPSPLTLHPHSTTRHPVKNLNSGNPKQVKETVKRNSSSPRPRHGAISRDKRFVYFKIGTVEFETYAKEFAEANGRIPETNEDGRWFKWVGEENAKA